MNRCPATTLLLVLLLTTACLDDSPDPEETAHTVCERLTVCFLDEDLSEQARQDFLSSCIDDHHDNYVRIGAQRGDECLDAHLETELCLARRSCEDWEADRGCEDEWAREEQLC